MVEVPVVQNNRISKRLEKMKKKEAEEEEKVAAVVAAEEYAELLMGCRKEKIEDAFVRAGYYEWNGKFKQKWKCKRCSKTTVDAEGHQKKKECKEMKRQDDSRKKVKKHKKQRK